METLEDIPEVEIFCFSNIIDIDSNKKLVYKGDKIIIGGKKGKIVEIEYGMPSNYHLGRIKVLRDNNSRDNYYIGDEGISRDWRNLI